MYSQTPLGQKDADGFQETQKPGGVRSSRRCLKIKKMPTIKTCYHSTLASYFQSKPLYLDEPTQKEPNKRKLVEQPWQQTKVKQWDEVTQTLCNLDFIQAKAAAKMTYELVHDFNAVLLVLPDNQKNIRKENERHTRLENYAKDLVLFANGAISELEVPESIIPWNQKRIDSRIESIRKRPTNLNKLNSYSLFLGQELGILHAHAHELKGLTIQQAWNNYNSGPVGSDAEKASEDVHSKLLLRIPLTRQPWTPLPQVLKRFKGHTDQVNAVAVSANAKYMISGSDDKTCIFWNLISGQPLKILIGHNEGVRSVAITPDGKTALSASYSFCILWDLENGCQIRKLKKRNLDGINAVSISNDAKFALVSYSRHCTSDDNLVILWELKKGNPFRTLNCHDDEVNAVTLTPDCKNALTASYKKCILWDLDNGLPLKTLEGHTGSINAISITPNGKLALTGSHDETCILWNMESGQPLKTLIGNNGEITSVAITPDGKFAVTGSDEHTCIFWDLETGQPLKVLASHSAKITSVSITPDGKQALSGSEDHTCILWDLERGNSGQFPFGHSSGINSLSVSKDGRFAVTCTDLDKTFTLWDIENRRPLKTISWDSDITDVIITPDGTMALTLSNDKFCILWDLKSGLQLRTLKGHNANVSSMSATLDGNFVLTGSEDKTCILWDLGTGQAVKKLSEINEKVTAVGLTPGGDLAMSGLENGNCVIWDLKTGKEIRSLLNHTQRITSIAVASDGKSIVTGSDDETCILWDIESGKMLKKMYGNSRGVRDVKTTPDGKYALSNCYDDSCILWDLSTGLQVKKIKELKHGYSAVALIQNGNQALVGTYKSLVIWDLKDDYPSGQPYEWTNINSVVIPAEGKIALSVTYTDNFVWDMNSGQLINLLRGDKYISEALDVTPDGKIALTGDQDGNCILWDTRDGLQIKMLGYNLNASYKRGGMDYTEEPVMCIKITPDGKRALSGDIKGNCILWDIEKGKEMRRLKGKVSSISNIILSQDGRFAIIGRDKDCILWDLNNDKQLIKLRGNKAGFNAMVLAPDGKVLITGSGEGGLILWDIKTGEIIKKLIFPGCEISGFSLAPQGNFLVTKASYDDTFAYWSLISGNLIKNISGHNDEVTDVVISNCGKYALSTSADTTCILHDLENGIKIGQFFSDESINCLSTNKNNLVLGGGGTGKLYFLKLPATFFNSSIKNAIVRRIWDFNLQEYQNPTSICPACGKSFEPDQSVLDCISQITEHDDQINGKTKHPDLSVEKWNNAGLTGACTCCGEKLKFSPFISGLDNLIYLNKTNPNESNITNGLKNTVKLKKADLKEDMVTQKTEKLTNDFEAEKSVARALFRDGDYLKSNGIYKELLDNGFQELAMHLNLARIALITDDIQKTIEHVNLVWEHRSDADPHILAQMLWFQLCINMIGVVTRRKSEIILSELKKLMQSENIYVDEVFEIQPVIDHSHSKIKFLDYAFLTLLAAALNHHSWVDNLEDFEVWRLCNPKGKKLIQDCESDILQTNESELSIEEENRELNAVRLMAISFFPGKYLSVKYLLEGLLENDFEVLNTRLNLATIALLTNDLDEIKNQIASARDLYSTAADYDKARLLWFLLYLNMSDVFSDKAVYNLIKELKYILIQIKPRYDRVEFILNPVIQHLNQKSGDTNIQLLAAILSAMDRKENYIKLENFDLWLFPEKLIKKVAVNNTLNTGKNTNSPVIKCPRCKSSKITTRKTSLIFLGIFNFLFLGTLFHSYFWLVLIIPLSINTLHAVLGKLGNHTCNNCNYYFITFKNKYFLDNFISKMN